MSSTIGTYHPWHAGGIALSSSVEITCISKQYKVSGQLGVGFLARDWDGECDGALPNTSGSYRPFQPLVGVRMWPSVWILISEFKLSRSLDLVAIDMKTLVMNWNFRYVHTVWVQRPMEENKDTNGLAVTTSYPWWSRDLFIHYQWIPLQMWGHPLPGKKVFSAFSNHQIGYLRDGDKLPQLHTAEPDLLDPATSFWAHPGMPENVTKHRDAEWVSRLIKVMIYLVCTNVHLKIAVLATPIPIQRIHGGEIPG